jgi:hypothetical protein
MALVNRPLAKNDIAGSTIFIGMISKANDRWHFIPTLTVYYYDGSKQQWQFPETYIKGTGSLDEAHFEIGSVFSR